MQALWIVLIILISLATYLGIGAITEMMRYRVGGIRPPLTIFFTMLGWPLAILVIGPLFIAAAMGVYHHRVWTKIYYNNLGEVRTYDCIETRSLLARPKSRADD